MRHNDLLRLFQWGVEKYEQTSNLTVDQCTKLQNNTLKHAFLKYLFFVSSGQNNSGKKTGYRTPHIPDAIVRFCAIQLNEQILLRVYVKGMFGFES